MIPDPLLFLEPGIGSHPKHVVVGKARTPERPGKDRFLLGRRIEPETVGSLDVHSHSILHPCKQRAAIPLPPQVGSFLAGAR